ncbi:RNA ligase-domain-containing protein [Gloeopeniophorella convolvens]|nr:RNA ligase-domain-containing protein [Gloeopeniophorella convolvens]
MLQWVAASCSVLSKPASFRLRDVRSSPLHSLSAMAPRSFSREDSQLITDLHNLHKESPKLVKSSEYAAPAAPDVTVESWKMNEYKYYDIPSPFPTLARGLFSVKEEGPDSEGAARYRIVARGYDKFFNIGEVPWTTWSSLETHTTAPYTLTLKSNGCIIFIAALSPSKLLVTSKHSLGPIQDVPESHAQVGERWLHQHLEKAGKTAEQLAEVLWEKKWTAVAELCDDSFEEHVLPYSADKTGLHLHGLNECTKHFKTQPPAVIDAFAREWGFIVTPSLVLPSIAEVKAYTEEVGRTGKWNGEAVEGFVVRTTVGVPPTSERSLSDVSPYEPGSSFFFKVKFDEPYMMYRDWREITKVLLSRGESARLPKNKMKRAETQVYVEWVRREIQADPTQFEGFTKGRGIIATRQRFLRWLETEEGKSSEKKALAAQDDGTPADGKKFGKTIIMPIAIPGVGKTSIAIALIELFGFGHTQSDDIRAKKPAPIFIRNVKDLLNVHDVVIADKNNHLKKHRAELRDAVKDFDPPVRLLALHWPIDQPLAMIHRICADRILSRGANHQSLHGDAASKAHEDVLWQFLKNSEPLEDGEADATVELPIGDNLEDMLTRAVDGITRVLELPHPDAERVGGALAAARGYAPARTDAKQPRVKALAPRYFGLLVELDLVEVLSTQLETQDRGHVRAFWDALRKDERVARRPHVTIVHSKQLPDMQPLWERCVALHGLAQPPLFCARLGHIVANERIMAATVDDLRVDDPEADEGQEGSSFVSQLGADLAQWLHMTIGTKDASVLPVEAGVLVEAFRKGELGINSVPLKDIIIKGRVKGLFS